jgi:hypothetical protein
MLLSCLFLFVLCFCLAYVAMRSSLDALLLAFVATVCAYGFGRVTR